LSRKSRKAKAKAKSEEQSENRLFYLVLMLVVGPAIIISSLGTGYYYGALLGLALEVWGIWETPEIHPYLKLIINWKSRKQDVKVNDSQGSNVITVQDVKRDIIIQLPEKKPAQIEDARQPSIYLELKPGFMAQGNQTSETLVYLQASNRGTVPVFIPSLSSLQILLPDGKYWIPREDWKANRDFPLELGPGRSLSIWRDMRGFVASLKKNEYSGKVKLRVICMDEAGRVFTGGEILFDIDDWAKA
jgi:hypothetical protein